MTRSSEWFQSAVAKTGKGFVYQRAGPCAIVTGLACATDTATKVLVLVCILVLAHLFSWAGVEAKLETVYVPIHL